jgi:hypothetical protein
VARDSWALDSGYGACVSAFPIKAPPISHHDIRAYLEREEKSVLVELLYYRAMWDSTLLHALRVRAAAHPTEGHVDTEVMKDTILGAIRTDHVDWRGAHDYVTKAEEVVEALGRLVEARDPSARELVDIAATALDANMGNVDDESGELEELLEKLQALHHKTCANGDIDPLALARRLNEWNVGSTWDLFRGAPGAYADYLGVSGVAEYWRLMDAAWAKIPQLLAGQRDPGHAGYRRRIMDIMLKRAKESGRLEDVIAVLSRDLSGASSYVRVATACRDAGDHERARTWAEKGLRMFQANPDARLLEFLVAKETSPTKASKERRKARRLALRGRAESPILPGRTSRRGGRRPSQRISSWVP